MRRKRHVALASEWSILNASSSSPDYRFFFRSLSRASGVHLSPMPGLGRGSTPVPPPTLWEAGPHCSSESPGATAEESEVAEPWIAEEILKEQWQ